MPISHAVLISVSVARAPREKWPKPEGGAMNRLSIREMTSQWNKEVLLALLGVSLLGVAQRVQAQCIPGDNYHVHTGADHCDSSMSGCTTVCG